MKYQRFTKVSNHVLDSVYTKYKPSFDWSIIVLSLIIIFVVIGVVIHRANSQNVKTSTSQSFVNSPVEKMTEPLLIPLNCRELTEQLEDLDKTFKNKKINKVLNIVYTDSLVEWDYFRIATYDLAEDFKQKYQFDMEVDEIYRALMKVFYIECSFKTGELGINLKSNAKGIIQFTSRTRNTLSVPENINEYELIYQLPFVFDYFEHKIKQQRTKTHLINSFVDVYCVVFAPYFADKPDGAHVYSSCKKRTDKCKFYNKSKNSFCAYHGNRIYDVDKSGIIQKYEIADYLASKYSN